MANEIENYETEIDRQDLIDATQSIMDFCQGKGMSELLAYMAMITITKTMEETLGFGSARRTQS